MMKAPSLSIFTLLRNELSSSRSRADLALNAAKSLGDVVRLPVPGKKIFLVSHPRDVRRVMIQNNDNYGKSYDYEVLALLVGRGLLTTDDETWRKDRKLLIGLFQQQKLVEFAPVVSRCTEERLDAWAKAPGGRVAMDLEVTRIALEVIGHRLLSLDVTEFSEPIAECLDVCQEQILARGNALVDIAKYIQTPAERRFRKALKKLDEIISELVRRRREDPALAQSEDLYALLVKAGKNERETRDQLVTFFLAGHETSAVALGWLFHCLSHRPEIQERLRAESRKALGTRSAVFEDLPLLPFHRQTIEEGLRLYPAVSFMGRQARDADELGGFPIPKDGVVVLCPYATQRRPDLWENAEEFNPDRWSPEAREKIPVGAFYPFALGPRGCMGFHFAMMELQLILSRVMQRYRLEPDPEVRDLRPVPLISMRPNQRLWMRALPV